MRRLLLFTLFSVSALLLKAQDPEIDLEDFATGLNRPVDLASVGDDRIFVAEQHQGRIRILDENGNITGTFLDIGNQVSTGSEQGLLGLAFHPNYASNGYFYVNYIDRNENTRVCRFQVSSTNPNLANPASEVLIMFIQQPFSNHNGGSIKFGPDGYLYISSGDGGSRGDPNDYAQNLGSNLGKILRIDVDGAFPYAIPSSNPFLGQPNANDEIWAYGVRNPWKISFDRETGGLWMGDVGQNAFEEINYQPASSDGGENYGWRCYEGNAAYNTSGCNDFSSYVAPVLDYSRSSPNCSVTGGIVYRGEEFENMQGYYFFSDYCSSIIWSLKADGQGDWDLIEHGNFSGNLASFGEDNDGNLYALFLGGEIKKVLSTNNVLAVQAIEELESSLYPNPTNGVFTFDNKEKQQVKLEVSSLQGASMLKLELAADQQIDFGSDLLPGVYVLSVQKDDFIYQSKIIKR